MTPTDSGLDTESRRLAARIVDAVPVTQLAFLKLLGLLEIRASREVATACVTLGARSRLLINPDFARAHCATDEALVMLVLHELFHVLLGHTRLHALMTPAAELGLRRGDQRPPVPAPAGPGPHRAVPGPLPGGPLPRGAAAAPRGLAHRGGALGAHGSRPGGPPCPLQRALGDPRGAAGAGGECPGGVGGPWYRRAAGEPR